MQNSTFFKRLRSEAEVDENGNRYPRQRTMSAPTLPGAVSSSSSTPAESTGYGDRFVPFRVLDDMRTDYNLKQPKRKRPSELPRVPDPMKDRANGLFTSILKTELASDAPPSAKRRRLLSFTAPKPHPLPSTDRYSSTPVSKESRKLLFAPAKPIRSVCKAPYRVLDAPNLANDFYLSVVDWSSANNLGVALGSSVYTLKGENAPADLLCHFGLLDPVSSVSWKDDGWTLAVGSAGGHMRVYDATTRGLIREYPKAHKKRIGAIDWSGNILTSGSRDGWIHHRDLREPGRPFHRFLAHKDDVCGLKWNSQDILTANLASGGNDNKVCIWDLRGSKSASGSSSFASEPSSLGCVPLWKFHKHKAAIKALAWSPHVNGLLATGGGSRDKYIRFWNTINGKMVHELDTGSQVCNLLWSRTSQELVSTHGHTTTVSRNTICIWRYSSLEMVTTLAGHADRILYLAMSPDGERIVTGSGDKTLRFWNAFPKYTTAEKVEESLLDYGKLIR